MRESVSHSHGLTEPGWSSHLLLIRGAARFAFIGASALESSSDEVGNDPVAEVGQKGRIGGGAVESGQAVSRRFSVCQIEVVCNHLLAQSVEIAMLKRKYLFVRNTVNLAQIND